VTIATANGGHQRTSTDGLSQATRAAALAFAIGTWVRDEEAAGSDLAVRLLHARPHRRGKQTNAKPHDAHRVAERTSRPPHIIICASLLPTGHHDRFTIIDPAGLVWLVRVLPCHASRGPTPGKVLNVRTYPALPDFFKSAQRRSRPLVGETPANPEIDQVSDSA
jgi:hypothetical protein